MERYRSKWHWQEPFHLLALGSNHLGGNLLSAEIPLGQNAVTPKSQFKSVVLSKSGQGSYLLH